jgi:predicted ester cyclase
VEEGDLVSSRWTITGTHDGLFQGVPATGNSITMPGVDMSRVADSKIAEHWAQFDLIGVMVQIGAMPAPV